MFNGCIRNSSGGERYDGTFYAFFDRLGYVPHAEDCIDIVERQKSYESVELWGLDYINTYPEQGGYLCICFKKLMNLHCIMILER